MNCYQARALLGAYLDGEVVDPEVMKKIEIHLTEDGACSSDHEALKALLLAVRDKTTYYKAPESLADKIRARIASKP